MARFIPGGERIPEPGQGGPPGGEGKRTLPIKLDTPNLPKTIAEFEEQTGVPFRDIDVNTIGTTIASGRGVFTQLDGSIAFLNVLRNEVKSGNLNLTDYWRIARPFAKQTTEFLNKLTTTGAANATAAKDRIPALRQFADFTTRTGQGDFKEGKIPFTQSEFAELPDSVLPSLEDLNKGLFPDARLPLGGRERIDVIAKPPVDEEPPVIDEDTGLPEEPEAPPGTDVITLPREDQTIGLDPPPVTEGEEPFVRKPPVIGVEDPKFPGTIIDLPDPGPVSREGAFPLKSDERLIGAESDRQAEQRRKLFETLRGFREKRLSDLGELLREQQAFEFEEAIPGINEAAQTGGLFRSSGLGEALAKEGTRLTKRTGFALAQQSLADREADIEGITGITQGRLGFQTAGLKRRFSLEDFDKQVAIAKEFGELGIEGAPTVPQGFLGGGAFSGALSGATAGAAIGSAFPGPGTAIGAGVGLVAGGIGGSK